MVNVGKGSPGEPDQGWNLFIVSVVMVIVSGLFVMTRVAIRAAKRMMGLDDWTILLTLVSLIFLTLTECLAVVNGYGKHGKDLTLEEKEIAFRWFYGAQIVYKVAVALYKLSMLFLYLRIFTQPNFQRLTYLLIGLVTAANTAFIIVTVFQCKPIEAFWNKNLLKIKGNHCFSSKAFWFSYSVVNICLDFLILLLPIHQILKLQLPTREKIALSACFSLGIFVCATTIIRTTTLSASANSTDPTWGVIPATIWSVVEANTGTICACLPTLKKPLMIIFPRLFPGTSHSSPGFFDRTPDQSAYALEENKGHGPNSKGSSRWKNRSKKDDTLTLKELDYNAWVAPSADAKLGSGKTERSTSSESEEHLTMPSEAHQPPFVHTGNTILRTTDVDVTVDPPHDTRAVAAGNTTAPTYKGRDSASSGDNSSAFTAMRTSPGKPAPGAWSSIDGNTTSENVRVPGLVNNPPAIPEQVVDTSAFVKRPVSPATHAFHLPRTSQDTAGR